MFQYHITCQQHPVILCCDNPLKPVARDPRLPPRLTALPSVSDVLVAMTDKSVGELFSLERVEFLGDAVLKAAASLLMFTQHTGTGSEAALSAGRADLIANEVGGGRG